MNIRQKKMLELLAGKQQNEYLTIQEMASVLGCSEKTIRNDFKQIDDWVKDEYQATIIRRPNIGVKIDMSAEGRKKLLSYQEQGHSHQAEDDINRKAEIVVQLMGTKSWTIHELSEKFYVSRHVIKQDLNEIESWLEPFGLTIESRKKVGIRLLGTEKDKRTALMRIRPWIQGEKESWFTRYEVEKAEQQVKKIEKELKREFSRESAENLRFHLLIMVKRIKEKQRIILSPDQMEKVKRKKEYEVVKTVICELEKPFVIKFQEEEIMYFFLHVLGAKTKNATVLNHKEIPPKIHSFLTDLIMNMSELTQIQHKEDESLVHSLAVHMESAFERIEHALYYHNPLLSDIKKTYPYTFDSLFHVVKELEESVGFEFPEDEIGYLVLHFEASKERLKKIDGKNKRAVVVCSLGIGMSQLLTTKMERKFHSLDIIKCVGAEDLQEVVKKEHPDFIISTIPLPHPKIPAVTVSPLLPHHDEEKLKKFISELESVHISEFSTLKKLVDQNMFVFKESVESPRDIIECLYKKLKENGYVNSEYLSDVVEREKVAPTTIGGEIAIPHGHPKNVLKKGVAVAVLKQPIQWKREMVSMVFMLAIKESDEETRGLFEEISFLGENKDIREEWKACDTKDDFFRNLR